MAQTPAVGKIFSDSRSASSASANGGTSAPSAAPTTILLIGSTGSGKSALGNFMLNPTDEQAWSDDGQTFRTARDNKPETAMVQCAANRRENPSLLIVDTPGLNESADKDLSHMIDIVSKLKELKSISACILCVKFDSKIDAQYKATVAYYRKLLPSLFERNVLIVMTNFLYDSRTEIMRRKQGLDIEAVIRNTQREVIQCAGLNFEPQVFFIDSLPLSEDERKKSEMCCSSILDYMQKSLKPILIMDMKVAKTPAVQVQDEHKKSTLNGKIHGYNQSLQQANRNAESALDSIERKERDVTETKSEIKRLEAHLQDRDSTETVTAKTWNLSTSWKFDRQSECFDIVSSWPIIEYTRWDNGHLQWTEFNWSQEPGRAFGKVEGEWFRGLYANVTLITQKRLMFKEEIARLQHELRLQQQRLEILMPDLEEFRKKESKYKKEIDQLRQFIDEVRAEIKKLSLDYMQIEEALERLKDLQSEAARTN